MILCLIYFNFSRCIVLGVLRQKRVFLCHSRDVFSPYPADFKSKIKWITRRKKQPVEKHFKQRVFNLLLIQKWQHSGNI